MMSAAGTPSTDPWVITPRERLKYEEQFKSLKPNGGIITGEQAKQLFLLSSLPPNILGLIWALADTDADGKMNIEEFSIACKLINLKLRGYEVPKMLPPSLLASSKGAPILASAAVPAPVRSEQPKVASVLPNQQQASLLTGLTGSVTSQSVLPQQIGGIGISTTIPTGIVTPMPSTSVQPLISTITTATSQPLVSPVPLGSIGATGVMPPVVSSLPLGGAVTTAPGIPPVVSSVHLGAGPIVPGISPIISSVPLGGVTTMPVMTTLGSGATITNVTPLGSSVPLGGTTVPGMVGPMVSSLPLGSTPAIPAATAIPTIPTAATVASVTNTPRGSVGSLDRSHSIESATQVEWVVPHQTKLKYTQMFNTHDRTRTGFLSGVQARNIMVQTKLPQNILAQIWQLSDMDSDGRLGCEEFVLAMHLCERVQAGNPLPSRLPLDLVPPSFRRAARTASISSQGSVGPGGGGGGSVVSGSGGVGAEQDPAATLLQQNSFEDKRKENFEKGQAELERRRRALLDQQRQEKEERERKEREEQERREKARQEAERKRLEELEKQMREQQEKERQMEEERKRQAEQREAARREMERQRQQEWEKQRLQDLQSQRQKEQENVLKLKAKNQTLTIELTSLNDQIKQLSQKICDTRMGVTNVKSTIDGMRNTRDSYMSEMGQLKAKLKEQNAKLLSISQEKAKLEAKNKLNAQDVDTNREINIKNLLQKVADLQTEIDTKTVDIENNNAQLTDLRDQIGHLVKECEHLYSVYETKRDTVVEMKAKINGNKWNEVDDVKDTSWPIDNTWSSTPSVISTSGLMKYRALYEFVARNSDEISFQPGDIINVPKEQTGEPGWLAGEIRGHTGWFPESYVEPVEGVTAAPQHITSYASEEAETARVLEGIAEVPETTQVSEAETAEEAEYYVANYPYQSQEQGDLTFNAGDVIAVVKKEGEWWTGKLGDNVGIFPSNYVQKIDAQQTAAAPAVSDVAVAAEEAETATLQQKQDDNEVSQITQQQPKKEKDPDSVSQTGSQIVKTKKPEIASVIAPYQSNSPEQLSLARGQLIMIRKKTDSGWWEGELQAKGRKRQVGWFPASYVKVLNSSGRLSGRTTPVSTTRIQQEVVIDKVITLYPYTAANPDELTFNKDDIISVTARDEESWWKGELNGVSGLFPSNYVAPFTQSNSSCMVEKKLRECIREFVRTERTYVKDLRCVHQVFETPLRRSGAISSQELDAIFLNWREIIKCNGDFLEDLLSVYEDGNGRIGEVICKHLPKMSVYTTFCVKQLDGAALLQRLTQTSPQFKELTRRCQSHPTTKGMPLSSFLIKPMQRITRYPLLITKIMENMDVGHQDYGRLTDALHLTQQLLNTINEKVRERDTQKQMEWLQLNVQNNQFNITFNGETNKLGRRKLLHYGAFTKEKSGKELVGFLFNDFFMLLQGGGKGRFNFESNGNIAYRVYKQPILIERLAIKRDHNDTLDSATDSNRVVTVQDNESTYKISLVAATVHECQMWLRKFEAAKEEYKVKVSMLNKQKSKWKTSSTATFDGNCNNETPTVGRLLVLLQTGKRFITNGKPYTENIYCRVNVGRQEQETIVAKETTMVGGGNGENETSLAITTTPRHLQVPVLTWNHSMQFQLKNVDKEIINFGVFQRNLYSPDEFLGKASLPISDILNDLQQYHNGPIIKKLILHQVESGEITVKLDIHMFNDY